MKVKMMMALAAVAVAAVAGAGTNYVEMAVKYRNPAGLVRDMSRDGELADPGVFRAALEAVDRALSTSKVEIACGNLSRRLPLTARAVLGRCKAFGAKARADMLATCGYDAENWTPVLWPGEAGYLNYAMQAAAAGTANAASVRSGILNAAIVPARRKVRAEGGSFVGKEGAKLVKAKLDALAAELNAPRFGKAGELLKELGIEVEWEFIQGRILPEKEVAEVRTKLMDGEIPFGWDLQNRLCVAMGVDGYNAFVKEYNEGSKK